MKDLLTDTFEVDPYFSSTNTNYGGHDPAILPDGPQPATFDP